jgi:hypothetical protein
MESFQAESDFLSIIYMAPFNTIDTYVRIRLQRLLWIEPLIQSLWIRYKEKYMEFASVSLAFAALIFSMFCFVQNTRQQKRNRAIQKIIGQAAFDASRDSSFEGHLVESPSALALHGVDLDVAKQDGVTHQQIGYLVLSVSGLRYYCDSTGTTISEHLQKSHYRQRMFAQPITRLAWKYARCCLTKSTRTQVDEFITSTHGDDYPILEKTEEE